MTSWMVPSPPQAKTVSLPAATAQRALSFASWLERQTVSSVRTPADWMMPMAWSSSASRFLPRRPELGLNRIVALRMRRASSDLSLTYVCERGVYPLRARVSVCRSAFVGSLTVVTLVVRSASGLHFHLEGLGERQLFIFSSSWNRRLNSS